MPVAKVAAGRRMPVRTVDVSFEWEGMPWSATLRTNAPSRVMDDFYSDSSDRMKAALKELVVAWDFVDTDGTPIPLPADGGLGEVPYPLLRETISQYITALVEAAAPPKDSASATEPG